MTDLTPPTLQSINAAATRLAPFVRRTPVWEWRDQLWASQLGRGAEVSLKLELFQHSGTFKARGAVMNILSLSADQRRRGVTAVSAGNHAAAVAYAARTLGTSAKVVMPKTASPARIALCRRDGATVVLTEDVHEAFAMVKHIEVSEERAFVHPFEGLITATGTATLGLEFLSDIDNLDAIVVPIGGGGLIGGVAAAVKQLRPSCRVYGVEPEGNDVIKRSVASGQPEQAGIIRTIADSLSPPFALPYSLSLVKRFVDDIVLVSDADLAESMYLLFERMKLAVEPAGAATTAALLGPLRERVAGQRVGLVVCGSNIDTDRFSELIRVGRSRWEARPSNTASPESTGPSAHSPERIGTATTTAFIVASVAEKRCSTPSPNSIPAPAGRVSRLPQPPRRSRRPPTPVMGCGGPRFTVGAVEPTSGTSFRTVPDRPVCAIASTPPRSISSAGRDSIAGRLNGGDGPVWHRVGGSGGPPCRLARRASGSNSTTSPTPRHPPHRRPGDPVRGHHLGGADMSALSIRRASPADLELLVPLFDGYRQFYRRPSDPTRARAFLADRLRNGDSIVFLAFLGAGVDPAGFAQLYPMFSSVSIGRSLILNDLYVTSASRGRGVGRALIERAVEFGRETGALYLELATEVTNQTAQRLYQAAGWRRDTAFYHYEIGLDP